MRAKRDTADRPAARVEAILSDSQVAVADNSTPVVAELKDKTCSDMQPCCDAGADAEPFGCASVRPLALSDPMVISGTVAAGQTVTMQITLTDTDLNGFVSYPGAFLTSSTPGVTFATSEAGPAGADIDGTMSKPITFYVKLSASIPSGTDVQISARACGPGGPTRDCNGFVLSFSVRTS